jgi:hypothetical protein
MAARRTTRTKWARNPLTTAAVSREPTVRTSTASVLVHCAALHFVLDLVGCTCSSSSKNTVTDTDTDRHEQRLNSHTDKDSESHHRKQQAMFIQIGALAGAAALLLLVASRPAG